MWLITNKQIHLKADCVRKDFLEYSLYTDELILLSASSICWFVEGHLLSCNDVQFNQKDKGPESHLPELFRQHGDSFIQFTKGNFTLLQLKKESFKIYSDRFGIKKFFYWISGNEFVISDDLKIVIQAVGAKPLPENMAIYALTYHFIGGMTIFEDIHYNKPAEVIEFKDGKLSFSTYWDAGELLEQGKHPVAVAEIAEALGRSVEQGVQAVPDRRISLSLTGGADTRNLLAVFLSKGIKPHLYTYGNPKSADCVKARAIAEGLGLSHDIHDIRMSAGLFESYAKKIIRLGQGLASIHRVHRLLAIEREKAFADVMFLGTLGGEFIKGVSEDDYIVPAIIYENWTRTQLDGELIGDYYRSKALKAGALDSESLLTFLNSQPFFNGDVVKRKFYSLSHLTASLHDAQDVNLYGTVMGAVFTPFLDADYLKTIFASPFSFDVKERRRNKFFKRIDNPVYASQFLKQVYPPLLQFEYSGNHKPSEVLFNKYYAALIKAVRSKMRPACPPNFPLSNWMVEFVERNLPRCRDYDVLRRTFDLGKLLSDLKQGQHIPKESYWLRFTNPIMMMYTLEEFGQ